MEDNKRKWFVIGIIVLLVISGLLIKTGVWDRFTIKLVCKQQPYEDKEYYTEQVPYQDTEYYDEIVSGKNCDYAVGCACIHKSWFGLGACDSCSCSREQTVTKYRTETKSRTVTKYEEVCVKLRRWKSPNYNENWLNYPERYDNRGNRLG